MADERGNGVAQLIEARGAVVPTDLERSEVKIEFFNYGIQGRTVGGTRDIRGSLRDNGPSVFVGSHPHSKQATAGSAQAQ